MAKDMFDISDDAWGVPQEAVKEFTDREDPQEAFERKIRVLNENWKKSFYVLCYYGIGGIGKTSFVNKLCRVIRGVEGNELRLLDKIDCNYIRYDFDAKTSGIDKLSILLSLRKQLGEADKNFKFFRFDSAVLLYAKKSGSSIEKDQTAQSLLEGNPWLDAVMSTVGTIPVVGWVSGVFQAIDKSAKTVKEAIGKHVDEAKYRSHLNEIDGMEMPELLGKLHEYFILDMRYNMQQVATKPMIVFLDTYERYIDTLNREISMITEDHWLRKGNKSVIRSVPGMLWVITGREKLYWAEDDAWDEPEVERPLSQMSEAEKEELALKHLEQHLLGDLSLKDATGFLKKAGISNDTLCTQLYKLTNGTPLFLDICVDTYHDLCSRGIPTEQEQFGEDLTQLISRYLSNMTNENREMTYFLACLGKWNDESVQRIAKEATTLRWYTQAKYESFVKHSFIIKNLDGSYYIHETVRSAALKNADKEILGEIGRIKLSVVKECVESDTTLDSGVAFGEYTKTLAENSLSYEEFYESLKTAKRKFASLQEAGSYDVLYTSSRELFLTAVKNYPSTEAEYIARSEYGSALRLKGFVKEALEVVSTIPLDGDISDVEENDWLTVKMKISGIYIASGMYQESFDINKQLFEATRRVLGEEHPDTLISMNNLAHSYSDIGETQKALELQETTLELMKRAFGEEHPATLAAMGNLANLYSDTGEKHKALELREQTLEQKKRAFGEEHPATLTAMGNLINSYWEIGEEAFGLELGERTLELMKRVFGETHPDTLKMKYNIATFYNKIKQYQKALELLEQVLEERRRVLGEEHPDTKKTEEAVDLLELLCTKKEKNPSPPLTPEEKEVDELRVQLAEQNDPVLRCKLAARHLEGRGIELNAIKAFELYREAAEQGNCAALFCQAILYLQGHGTTQDVHVAFDLFKKAAEHEHANAQFMMSLFYGTGRVVVRDEQKAVQWYEKALQNGVVQKAYEANKLFLDCEDARNNLGLLVAWHEHTSYQEFAISRCNFGYMYETGRGVEADKERAKEWYEKAARQGDEVAENLLTGLKKPGLFGKLFVKSGKK